MTHLSHRSILLSQLALFSVLLGVPGNAFADCDAEMRPVTALEKKLHDDAVAMFKQVAPPAPAGWTAEDGDTTLPKLICAAASTVSNWRFNRQYHRNDTEQRRAQKDKEIMALVEKKMATAKANQAKIDAIQKQLEAAGAKMGQLAAAGKFAEIEALQKDTERLQNEQLKLMGGDTDAEEKTISAKWERDTTANFSLSTDEPSPDTTGMSPIPVAAGMGFRRVFEGNPQENPFATLNIVLPPVTGLRNPTVIFMSGDPDRVDGLLKTIKLR